MPLVCGCDFGGGGELLGCDGSYAGARKQLDYGLARELLLVPEDVSSQYDVGVPQVQALEAPRRKRKYIADHYFQPVCEIQYDLPVPQLEAEFLLGRFSGLGGLQFAVAHEIIIRMCTGER